MSVLVYGLGRARKGMEKMLIITQCIDSSIIIHIDQHSEAEKLAVFRKVNKGGWGGCEFVWGQLLYCW